MSLSLQAATSAQYFIQMPGKVLVTLGYTQVITTSIWMHTKKHRRSHTNLIPTDGHTHIEGGGRMTERDIEKGKITLQWKLQWVT